MICIEKECKYREFNTCDDISDFYFCKMVGIEVNRGKEECLVDKYKKECDKVNFKTIGK